MNLLGVVVGAARTADPEQVLDFAIGGFGGDVGEDGDVEAFGPVHALVLTKAPRIAAALDVLHRVGDFGGHVALHHHEGLADADHRAGHGVDEHRADVDAGAAGGAGPGFVDVDAAVDLEVLTIEHADLRGVVVVDVDPADEGKQLECCFGLFVRLDGTTDEVARGQHRRRVSVEQVALDVAHHFFGLQRLVREVRRADGVTAATLGAGDAAKQRLQWQLRDAREAVFLGGFEIDARRQAASAGAVLGLFLAVGDEGLGLAPGVGTLAVHEGVRTGEHEMHVLGVGDVTSKGTKDKDVDPPAEEVPELDGRRARDDGPRQGSERRERCRPVEMPDIIVAEQMVAASKNEVAQLEGTLEEQNDFGIHRPGLQAWNAARKTSIQRAAHRNECQERKNVLGDVIEADDPAVVRKTRQIFIQERLEAPDLHEVGQPLDHDLDMADAKHQKTIHEKQVQDADPTVFEHLRLPHHHLQHHLDARGDDVGPGLVADAGIEQDADPQQSERHIRHGQTDDSHSHQGIQDRKQHRRSSASVGVSLT